jgi:thioredoxin 1
MRFGGVKFFVAFSLILAMAVLGHTSSGSQSGSPPPQARPALYEFGAKTCLPCIQMQQVMAELKQTHGDQVEFRMVYADENKDLFPQYKIMLIPTQVFLDASGQEVDRHIGPLTKEEVLQKLKELKFIQ